MTASPAPIALRRLRAQGLAGPGFTSAAEATRHLVAVQSQDYPGATWALGQRVRGSTEATIDAAFDAGELIRTHVLRPTWHFVAPEDLRWLLALTAPRVHQASAYQYRTLEIDDRLAGRAADVFRRELEGGRHRTRDELAVALQAAGIDGVALRLTYLVMHAELDAVICSGPRRGKRQTYALVDERVPVMRARSREEALAELARRYVEGHGPAQAIDLSWWSGLTIRDARLALELATPPLLRERAGERERFVAADGAPGPDEDGPLVHLLPNYDELLIAFRDRSDAPDPALPDAARVAEAILAHIVVRDGLVVGGWRRSLARAGAVQVEPWLLVDLNEAERDAFDAAIARLEAFLGRPVEVVPRAAAVGRAAVRRD